MKGRPVKVTSPRPASKGTAQGAFHNGIEGSRPPPRFAAADRLAHEDVRNPAQGGHSMSERRIIPADEMKEMAGQEIGVSRWFDLSQERINNFADVTEDWQYIHVDPERAAGTPFGGTIAHGFLTLSMLSAMAVDAVPRLENAVMGVNYGFDKIRFLSPAPSGSRIRARFTVLSADELKPGEMTMKYEVEVEIEGRDRPALMAEWISRQYFRSD
jgi:acyl dehydratase